MHRAKTAQSSSLENEEEDLPPFEFGDSQSNLSSLYQTFSNADFADGEPFTSQCVLTILRQCFYSTFQKARKKAMSQDLLTFSLSFDFLCYLQME
jgi:hypothetical protein